MTVPTYSEHFEEVLDLLNRKDLGHKVAGWTGLVETTLVQTLRDLNQNAFIISGLNMVIGQDTLDLPEDASQLDFIRIDTNPIRRMDLVDQVKLSDIDFNSGPPPAKGTGTINVGNFSTGDSGKWLERTRIVHETSGLVFILTADTGDIAPLGFEAFVPVEAERPGKAYEVGMAGSLVLADGFFNQGDSNFGAAFDTPITAEVGGNIPLAFTVSGPRQIRMAPAPNDSYEYTLFYRRELAPVDQDKYSSLLLEEAPALMLYATAFHGAAYIEDAEKMASYSQLALRFEADYEKYLGRRKLGGGILQIRPDTIPNDSHTVVNLVQTRS